MENKIYKFKASDSVYVLNEVIRKTVGADNAKATAITNALYRDHTDGVKTIGAVKELLSTEDGKKRLLRCCHMGPKRLELLEKAMEFVEIEPIKEPVERSIAHRVYRKVPAGYTYIKSVDGCVIIDIRDGNTTVKRSIVCEGGELGRLAYVTNHEEEVGLNIYVEEGFVVVADLKTKFRYFYNKDKIVQMHVSQYKVVIKEDK